jgi:hypothetical protein
VEVVSALLDAGADIEAADRVSLKKYSTFKLWMHSMDGLLSTMFVREVMSKSCHCCWLMGQILQCLMIT